MQTERSEEMSDINDLLKKREDQYGQAWLLTGLAVKALQPHYTRFVEKTPEFSNNWMQILMKLVRILFSPTNADHWRDIEGYAKLVRDYLESDYGHSGQ